MIPEDVIAEVLRRTDIVELIGGYLPLKSAGRTHKALCPFHNEKTPSFVVNPERQIFHCFGCGEGGDAIAFLVKHERLSFLEAVRFLAERAGVSLPAARGGPVVCGELTDLRCCGVVTAVTDRDCDAVLVDAAGTVRCRQPLWVRSGVLHLALDRHGGALKVAWRNAPGNRWDWIGVLAAGQDPLVHEARCYAYTDATIEGSRALPTAGLDAGDYEVVFCVDDGYECLARAPFRIE